MNISRRITCAFLSVLLVGNIVIADPCSRMYASAAAPSVGAAVTKSNILKLLDKYDKDGAYIVRHSDDSSLLFWFGNERIVDRIVTAVHEQFHVSSFAFGGECYYLGKGRTVFVEETGTFYSQKAAKSVPARLRTFRFHYMTDSNLSSNAKGAYGLLNEFAAYGWGLNTSIKLRKYLKKNGCMDVFHVECQNNINAYAEFSYYILHYLYYAKKHDKFVYNDIMANEAFRQVFKLTDKRFRKNIKTYYQYAAQEGYQRRTKDDYSLLMKEISKKKYQRIYKDLMK